MESVIGVREGGAESKTARLGPQLCWQLLCTDDEQNKVMDILPPARPTDLLDECFVRIVIVEFFCSQYFMKEFFVNTSHIQTDPPIKRLVCDKVEKA